MRFSSPSVRWLALLPVSCGSLLAQVPAPWTSQDVGGPALAGSATESGGTFTIDGAGADIWGTADEFHFVFQPLAGDLSVIARVDSLSNTDPWAKAGVMIRSSLDANAAHAMVVLTPGNGAQFQRRLTTGGTTGNTGQAANAPRWVRIDRVGATLSGYHSADGLTWAALGSETIAMAAEAQVGLAVTSHQAGALCTAVFNSVSVGPPPPPPPPPAYSSDGYLPLFNGVNFDHWYTFLDGLGVDNDPQNALKVADGAVHLLDIADTASTQPFGYFATRRDFRNYRLRYEYRWGTKKYPPRATAVRDSGLLYHFRGADVIWPTCVESQVQENDTGDFFLLGGTRLDTTIVAPGNNTYQPGGTPLIDSNSRIIRSAPHDLLTDWNVAEAIVTADEGIHVVNGHVNNRGTRFTHGGLPLTEGRIAFQVEGAEVFYRKIELQPLFTTGGGPPYRVLVFSKTTGFRHGSIAEGIAAIEELGARNNFLVETTEDASQFNDANLARFACVVFLNTTGDPLDNAQQAAFERYIQAGGGYAGVHAATDTEYAWPWYGALVGAYFDGHPAQQNAEVHITDPGHPSTESIGTLWPRFDEWYNFDPNPADNPNIRVLATLDESTYSGGTMGTTHPISWCQEFDGGRSWYTGMGHTDASYSEPLFRMHLLGGIEWAAGQSREATGSQVVLFDGTDTTAWKDLDSGGAIGWQVVDGALEVVPGQGHIATTADHGDLRLHLEFRPNATSAPGEQDRGNSGVFLQGRYEVQILDSYDHPLEGENDCGAIYGIRNAASQQAWPAEAWQHYDLWFRAARWDGAEKVEDARLTVFWNGVRVHDGVAVPASTTTGAPEGPADGPLVLQDHGNAVRFRNIWIEPGATLPVPADPRIAITTMTYDAELARFTVSWDTNLPGPFRIFMGDGGDLGALGPPDQLLPLEVHSAAQSPATVPVPVELQGAPALFLQVAR